MLDTNRGRVKNISYLLRISIRFKRLRDHFVTKFWEIFFGLVLLFIFVDVPHFLDNKVRSQCVLRYE